MTSDFTPDQYSPLGVNLFGSAIATSAQEKLENATFRDVTRWFYRQDPDTRERIGVDPTRVAITQIRITDLRNGWGQADDRIYTSTSTAYQAQRRHLLLPPKVSQTTLANSASGNSIMGWCHFGPTKQLVMTIGATVNACVAKETSNVDPTPVFLTYDPAGGVSTQGCAPIIIGGATSVERVAIFKNTAATEVLSDIASPPTSSGSMHANTASTWALGSSNINATTPGTGTLLIYAGNSIYTLAQTAALAAAPTQTLTNTPAGGAGLMGGSGGGSIEALQKNWLNRWYLWWPDENSTGSALAGSSANPGYVVSLNLEGTGPELVPTSLFRTIAACLWNRTVTRTDGLRITSFDGETERDLHFLKGRESNSDYKWTCSGLIVNGGELYALAQREDLSVNVITLGATTLRLERYLPEFDAWVPVTGAFTLESLVGNTDREAINGRISQTHNRYTALPVSFQTGFLHLLMRQTVWNRTWLPPEGVNPFLHYNKTGALDEISQQWAASAVWTSNDFPIRGFNGLPSVWLGCSASEMDIAAGGTGATVKVEVATQDGTALSFTGALSEEFTDSEPIDTMTRWWDETDPFTLAQVRLTLTQGTDTRKTPNALPLILYVMTFLDGQVVSPAEAGFVAWGDA